MDTRIWFEPAIAADIYIIISKMSNNNIIIFISYFIAKCDNTDNTIHKKHHHRT